MIDWILDIYDQTEPFHLVEITAIITLMISLCFVFILRIPPTAIALLGVWLITLILLLFPAMYLRDKSEERKATQIEQILVK
jgi:hypothetical protein